MKRLLIPLVLLGICLSFAAGCKKQSTDTSTVPAENNERLRQAHPSAPQPDSPR